VVRDGGVVLTTVRIHDRAASGDADRSRVAERWRDVALSARPWWPQVSSEPVTRLADRVAEFALRQERNAVYDLESLTRLFSDAGFDDVHADAVDVRGKTFARITAG
jgi:transposase